MTRQYIRSAVLTFEKGSDTITIDAKDPRALRFKFDVVHGEVMSPNSARITVYNLAKSSEAKFLQERGKVSLSAGYGGNDGLIFKGEIDQPPRGGPSGMLVDRGPFHHG